MVMELGSWPYASQEEGKVNKVDDCTAVDPDKRAQPAAACHLFWRSSRLAEGSPHFSPRYGKGVPKSPTAFYYSPTMDSLALNGRISTAITGQDPNPGLLT